MAQLQSSAVTGSLVVTGTITAQEFNTEFVSSSILFDSGSTAFGNSSDDVHNMTGSLIVNRTPAASQGNVMIIENKADLGSAQDLVIRNTFDRDIGIKFEEGGGTYYQWMDGNGDDSMIFSAANTGSGDITMELFQNHNVGIPNGNLTVGGTVTATSFSGTISLDFNDLNSKTSGTGEYSTSGYLTAGRGNGGVSLTHNDGGGNANVTFNHKDETPEQDGNAARIEVNTDSTSGAYMAFEIGSNVTAGSATTLTEVMRINESIVTFYKDIYIPQYIYHSGNTNTRIRFQTDDINMQTNAENVFRINGNAAQKEIVINEVGGDYDFRVEGDTEANLLMVDAANDRVGINSSAPEAKLHINNGESWSAQDLGSSSSGSVAFRLTGRNGATNDLIMSSNGTTNYTIQVVGDAATSGQLHLNPFGGNVGIGTSSPDEKLNVFVGAGGSNGTVGIKVGGTSNYDSLELGIEGNYAGMIRSYGNDLKYYAGHWRTIGNVASENHSHYWYTSKSGSADWSSAKMELDHDGNLGLGTTSPNDKLHIVGNLFIEDASPEITLETGASHYNWQIAAQENVTNALEFSVGSQDSDASNDTFTPKMVINSAGNVGIGTTATSDGDLGINDPKLHVYGPATSGYHLVSRFQAGNDADNTGAAIAINHSNDRGLLIKAGRKDSDRPAAYFDLIDSNGSTTNLLTLGEYGSEFYSIFNGGNVGIGTASPNTLLHIFDGAASNIATTDLLKLEAYTGDFGATPAAIALAFKFQDSNNSTNEARIRMATVNDTDYGDNDEAASNLIFSTTNGGTESDKMIITGRGEVGIGTTNPSDLLHLAGTTAQLFIENTASDGQAYIRFKARSDRDAGPFIKATARGGTATDSDLRFGDETGDTMTLNGGLVGIGTVSPAYKLSVNSGTTNVVASFKSSDNQAWIAVEDDASGTYGALLGTDSDAGHDIVLAQSSAYKRLVISSAGNVGIWPSATTSAQSPATNAALHVSGSNDVLLVEGSGSTILDVQGSQGQLFSVTDDLTGTLFAASDISGVPVFLVSGSGVSYFDGDVGIGTSNPSGNLHVKNGSSGDASIRLETTTGGDPTVYFNSAAANRSGLINFQDNGTNVGRIQYAHNGDKLQFQAGSATGQTLELTNSASSFTGGVTITSGTSIGLTINHDTFEQGLVLHRNHASNAPSILFKNNSGTIGTFLAIDSDNQPYWQEGTGTDSYKIWTANNDGPSSGLNADLLDGSHASAFALLSGATYSGNITISKDNPVLILSDTTSTSNADQLAYISFQDNGTEEAWIGWGSNGNSDFTISNSIGSVVLNGNGTTQVSDNLSVTGTGAFGGNLTVDAGTSTTLWVKCDDGGNAIVRASGEGQGTGVLEVGQSTAYGGGISYNGDGSPAWAAGESADYITFYRLDNNTRTEVFSYPYSSNNVTFNGEITATEYNLPSSGMLDWANGDARIVEGLVNNYSLSFQTYDGASVTSALRLDGNNLATLHGNATFGTPGAGSVNTARFLSIEGNADASGEGSGRIFFTEHNSSTAAMDAYGMSIGYRGGATTITGASGNDWTGLSSIGNGQWGMWGHDNNADGALIMYGDRGATYVDFAGNNIQGIADIYVDDQIISTGDTDTYFQFHAADQARIVCAGAEVMEWGNNYAKLNDSDTLRLGAGSDFRMWHDGTNHYFRNYHHAGGNMYWQGENTAGTNKALLYMYTNTATPYVVLFYDGSTKAATSSAGFDITGTLTATADVVAYSDERIKENIKTIDNALDKVKALRGVSYNRTDLEDKSTKVGVIAQEVQKVLPEVVQEKEDGMLSVSYGNMVSVLIEGMKEQQEQIEALKARIDELENK